MILETIHRTESGDEFPVELNANYIERGGQEYNFAFARDVTARKQAEEELTRSHELLSNLTRLVPGVVYQYRLYPDGRSAFPYSSPGMNDIYECTPEEVREDATPVFGRLHPDDYDRVGEAIQESARTLDCSTASSGSPCRGKVCAGAGARRTRSARRTAAPCGTALSRT